MSSVFYRYENNLSKVVKGVKNVVKEGISDGTSEGVRIYYLEKQGEKFYRINVNQMSNGNFEVKEKKDDKESVNEMKEADVMKMIKGNKNLKFAETYLTKERAKLLKDHKEGGAKRRKSSKKGSKAKKTSKKASKAKKSSKKTSRKRTSKKASKKGSKKGSKVKRTSRKSSKKTSKKRVAKKASKKTSKKGSKKSSRRRVKKA